ncbi:MAG TPA: hypothetical protein IGS17_01015 [Oscillatoriales cyanobacterium M59_W2019_021]|nr:hypothetical protein [Oscillatoriales cyanobacterium M59_W2019_021]
MTNFSASRDIKFCSETIDLRPLGVLGLYGNLNSDPTIAACSGRQSGKPSAACAPSLEREDIRADGGHPMASSLCLADRESSRTGRIGIMPAPELARRQI